jgi:predicted Zn-dependent protease
VLIALIVVAAAIALLFIGAAVGLWNLPWMTHPSAPRKPARPEVTSAAPAAPAPAAPAATPVPAAPAPQTGAAEPAPVAEQPAAPEPALPAVPTMTAEEAAPAHNAADSEAEEAADPPSVDTASVISAAKSELRSNNPTAAEALLQPLLEANPDDHHIAEIMARALLARGDAGKALSLTQRIVRKRPKRASYRVLLGDALRRAGDEAGAQAAYREALALDPNERDAQRRLSR